MPTLRSEELFFLHHIHNVRRESLHVRLERLIVRPEHRPGRVMQPHRHAPEGPFCGDERPNAQDHVQPGVLDDLRESHQIEPLLEVVLALGGLVAVPEHVGLDAVGAAVLGLGHQLRPHLGDAAGVVDGGGDEEAAAAGDDEGAVVIRDARVGARCGGGGGAEQRYQRQQQEE